MLLLPILVASLVTASSSIGVTGYSFEADHEVIKDFMSRNGDTSNHPQVRTSSMSSASSSSSMSTTSSAQTSKSSRAAAVSSKVPSFDPSIVASEAASVGQEKVKTPLAESSVGDSRLKQEVPPPPAQEATSSSSSSPSPSNTLRGVGCASPEVLVNGSPSPDILETVNGGKGGMGKIQEIQFVGVVDVEGHEKKRICKIKCLNGVWVGPLCTLEPECPSVNSTDSKLVMSVEGTKIHDRAHFSCLDDLQLVGADEITCTTQGSWSHAVPFCRVVQCPEVDSDDPNLKVLSSNRTLGSKSFFSCPEGYKLIGSPVSICLKNNTWSASVPFCQAITCPEPVIPSNGRVIKDSDRFESGNSIEYQCNSGFILEGESVSICTNNGSWSQPVPQCKPVCEYPGEPVNGYIVPTKFYYSIGEGISVLCKSSNLQHLGPSFIYCNSLGQWSSSLPSCVESTAPATVTMGNTEITSNQLNKETQPSTIHHLSKLQSKSSSSSLTHGQRSDWFSLAGQMKQQSPSLGHPVTLDKRPLGGGHLSEASYFDFDTSDGQRS